MIWLLPQNSAQTPKGKTIVLYWKCEFCEKDSMVKFSYPAEPTLNLSLLEYQTLAWTWDDLVLLISAQSPGIMVSYRFRYMHSLPSFFPIPRQWHLFNIIVTWGAEVTWGKTVGADSDG